MPGRGTLAEDTSAPVSPAAVRSTRPRWRDPRLAVGIAVVAVCALLGGRLLAASDDTVGVWAARGPLAEGQRLTADDLVRRDVRFGEQADADRYVSAAQPLPARLALARAVGPGELVPRAALGDPASARLTEVPVSVETGAVPSTVRVGSVVDVWVTPDAAGSSAGAGSGAGTSPRARSVLVFDDVPVVEVPRAADSLGPSATRQVLVGVPDDLAPQLPRLLAVLGSGDVLLTARR